MIVVMVVMVMVVMVMVVRVFLVMLVVMFTSTNLCLVDSWGFLSLWGVFTSR
jgi:hypothetical protein